jgi:hypothetical protein
MCARVCAVSTEAGPPVARDGGSRGWTSYSAARRHVHRHQRVGYIDDGLSLAFVAIGESNHQSVHPIIHTFLTIFFLSFDYLSVHPIIHTFLTIFFSFVI